MGTDHSARQLTAVGRVDAGLVEVRSQAQRRLYRVRVEPLRAVDDWLEPYRRVWESRLDDLEGHLDVMPDT
ncbi:MAG TPA: hypothetical protein VK585_11695 [Jiangellaceae bacterium]|nr:hypothetical protein [Jiangellaceae bacterium]